MFTVTDAILSDNLYGFNMKKYNVYMKTMFIQYI